MVAFGYARHAAPDIDDNPRTLMTEDRRKEPLRIASGPRELVGMADPGRLDLDQHLAVFGSVELNLLDLERLTGPESDSSACLHDHLPGFWLTRAISTQRGLSHLPAADDKSLEVHERARDGWEYLFAPRPAMRINPTTKDETGAQEEGCGCRSHTSAWVFCCRFSRFAPLRPAMSKPARRTSKNARSATPPRRGRTR